MLPTLQIDFDIFELLPVLLLGVIGGLLGSTFTYLNEMLTDWRKRGGAWGGGGCSVVACSIAHRDSSHT